jgi:hypothetical protein
VAIISESLARRVWQNEEDAIGRRIKFGINDPRNDQPWLMVAGAVGDVKAKLISNDSRLAVFIASNNPVDTMDVVIRTSAHPLSLASVLRHEVSQLDPNLPGGRHQDGRSTFE